MKALEIFSDEWFVSASLEISFEQIISKWDVPELIIDGLFESPPFQRSPFEEHIVFRIGPFDRVAQHDDQLCFRRLPQYPFPCLGAVQAGRGKIAGDGFMARPLYNVIHFPFQRKELPVTAWTRISAV